MVYTGTNREETLINRLNITNLNLKDNSLPISFNANLNNSVNNIIDYLLNKITQLEERVAEESVCSQRPGFIEAFAGNAIDKETGSILSPPNNYEWCFGQIVSKTDERYSALYSAIGNYWNVSSELTDDQFQLPDLRNTFLRGCTTDPNDNYRLVGTHQSCGVPNVVDRFGGIQQLTSFSGAFQIYAGVAANYYYDVQNACTIDYNARRCSSVYQDGLTEVRPDNKAVNYIIKL